MGFASGMRVKRVRVLVWQFDVTVPPFVLHPTDIP